MAALAAAALFAIATLLAPRTEAATPPTQHFALNVKDFTELVVVDGINVDYIGCSTDSAGYAVFDTTADLASQIMFEPSKGKLKVQLANHDSQLTGLPTVKVYSRYLSSVENDGDSLVRIITPAPGPKFQATLVGNGRLSVRGIDVNEASVSLVTGNGQLVVTGRCESANLKLTGTGSITADELTAKIVKCRVAGTGTIGCDASEELNVSGIGSGTVLYRGRPAIKKRGLGIKVNPLD